MLSIFFTYSRGGFLTLVATVSVLFLQNRSRFFPLLFTAAIGLSALQFLPVDYTSRLTTLFQFTNSQSSQLSDPSFRGRMSENLAAWRMFGDHPYFGVGLGNFKVQYQEYSRQIGLDPRRVERNPASLYMELLAEQGAVGITIFAFLMYMVFRGLVTARVQFARAGLHDHAHIAMSIFAALVGYLIAATVKNSAYSNVFWVLIGISISIEQVAYSITHVEETAAPSY
jgi:O-antigen ligase